MANQAATFNVAQGAANYTTGDLLGTYSGVNLWLSDDAADQITQQEIDELAPGGSFWVQKDEDGNPIILGYKSNPWSNTGRVLDIVNPFGTVAMASNILAALRQTNGIAINYSPFTSDAIIPPHFEIGDAVNINGDHHGIYAFETKASRLALSKINAPTDEEIDHEYPFRSDVKTRQLTRKFGAVQSQFNVQADKISTKVEETGINGNHTFGWSLTSRGFFINNGEVQGDGNDLFSFTASGLSIKGTIKADSGYIGGQNGFTIQSGKLFAGKNSLDSSASGVYVGTDGISLGSNFRVDTSGNVNANNMTLTGTLNVGGATITAAQLRQGAQSGYNWSNGGSYGGYSSQAAYALSGGGAGFSAQSDWGKAKTYQGGIGYIYANSFGCNSLTANSSISAPALYVAGTGARWVAVENASMVLGW